MFIKGAERSFADIEKLTDDLITHSSESKDREIARAGMRLEQQQLTLMVVLLVVAFAGIVVSFFDRPRAFPARWSRCRRRCANSRAGISKFSCPASTGATKSARWPTRSRNSRCRRSPRPNAKPRSAKKRTASGQAARRRRAAQSGRKLRGRGRQYHRERRLRLDRAGKFRRHPDQQQRGTPSSSRTVVAAASEETSTNVQSVAVGDRGDGQLGQRDRPAGARIPTGSPARRSIRRKRPTRASPNCRRRRTASATSPS